MGLAGVATLLVALAVAAGAAAEVDLCPASLTGFPEDSEMPMHIVVQIQDLHLDQINEEKMTFTILGEFVVSWFDDRLVNSTRHMCNILQGHDGEKHPIWVPDLHIYYNRQTTVTRMHTEDAMLNVNPYDGHVSWWFRLESEVLCPMHFGWYPLDAQSCEFVVGSRYYSEDKQVYGGHAHMSATRKQLQFDYEILPINFTTGDVYPIVYSVTGMHIYMERIMVPFLMNIYLPTGLLVMISWIGFLVPCDQVPGRMALLVTIFLMLVNVANTARNDSPLTSGLTALDVWLLSGMLFVALCLFEYAVLLYLRFHTKAPKVRDKRQQTNKDEDLERCNRIDRLAFVVAVVASAAFNIFYWSALLMD